MYWIMDLDIQRFLRQSAEERRIELDRWLQDFSLAFKGHPDENLNPNSQYVKDCFASIEKQKKEDAPGTLTLANSGCVAVKDPETGNMFIQNQSGYMGIAKADLAALAQFCLTPEPAEQPDTSTISAGQCAYNFSPQLKERHDRNMEALEKWAAASSKAYPKNK
jgi:hypothetical protein